MYKLAERLGCTIVKDMVVDRIQRLHRDEQRRKRAHPKGRFQTFELPLEYSAGLSLDEDAAFIHCIVRIILDRVKAAQRKLDKVAFKGNVYYNGLHFEWREDFSKEMIDSIEKHHGNARPVPRTEKCQRYHSHIEDEECYKVASLCWEVKTRELVSILFPELRRRAAQANKMAVRKLFEGQQGLPDEEEKEDLQKYVCAMIQFSPRREEKMAKLLCKCDGSTRGIASSTKGRNTSEKEAIACCGLLEKCERDSIPKRDDFRDGWINSNDQHCWDIEDDPTGTLPWYGT